MEQTIENPLAIQVREAKLPEHDAISLQDAFLPFFEQAEQWRNEASSIQVTSAEDEEGMKKARETRLQLQHIRCEVEKKRKELKEDSLRKGKAIDGMANVIKFLIKPIEEHLEKQEKFVELELEKKRQERRLEREAQLLPFGVDVTMYNLAEMSEEHYGSLLSSSQQLFKMKQDAEKKEREEAEAKAKAEREEAERIRAENEKLRKEAEARQKEIDQERAAKEKVEAELRAKQEEEEKNAREAKEQAAKEERKRIEQEKQAKLAPDKDKLAKFADSIVAIPMPDVTSPEARAVVEKAIDMLAKASKFVKQQSLSL